MKFMKTYENHTYALMRIMAGFLFLWHGTSKYFSYPEGVARRGVRPGSGRRD